MRHFRSLVDVLETHAREQPGALALRFLVDGENEEVTWTYAVLDQQARAIATALRSQCVPGARALLLYPPGLDYVAAFFGCLYAGILAVPAYPPDLSRPHRTLPRLKAIIADCHADVALSTEGIIQMVEGLEDELQPPGSAMRWLATDALHETQGLPVAAGPTDVAFLQYTSGSTSVPRGVIVTHGNLLHNLEAIAVTGGIAPERGCVTWLPPYHDMGLIGCILSPIHQGFPTTLLSPLHFLQRPWRWLSALSRFRATHSAAPNFAYDLCLRKTTPEQRAALDLRRWHICYDGAEPVSAATLQRFADAFAVSGLRRETLFPCFGLAEGTLISSGGRAQQPHVVRWFEPASVERGRGEPAKETEAVPLVGCGKTIPGQRVVIVAPQTCVPRVDGEVGEIWLAGPSVARGYWNRPEETAATFEARLADTREGPFLRTGDLGFLLDGELFVTGRLKDLLIVAGQNHYPQDLERSAEQSHPAVRPGASVAFSVPVEEHERAVLVLEVDPTHPAAELEGIRHAVRSAISRDHQLSLHDVVLVERSAVPRTSSGKVQRSACRAMYLSGKLVPDQITAKEHGGSLSRA